MSKAIKVLSVKQGAYEIVETNQEPWGSYRRYCLDTWDQVIGESLEPVYGGDALLALEAAYQAFVADTKTVRAPGGWQPIDTAPKDGQPVLVFGSTTAGGTGIGAGRWNPDVCEREELVSEKGGRRIYQVITSDEGYWFGRTAWDVQIFPEYWMPLPIAPEES